MALLCTIVPVAGAFTDYLLESDGHDTPTAMAVLVPQGS
jgi:hypothetical protein